MAEMIVSPIAEILLAKLGSLAYQEARLIWGFKTDLRKLEKTLKTIKAVLLDAEQQQLHNHEVRVWLEELKDVCYDAEDVFDEFEIEALQRQATVNRGSITQKVWNYLSWPKSIAFRFTIGHRIKEIRERLDEIAANKAKFHLTERVDNRQARREREMTHSFVFDSQVIGRDKEKEEIIELLAQPSDGDDRNISVIPIIGSLVLFKMHDLMHDLVLSMSNNECSMVNSRSQVISKKVRHVSFVDADTIEDGLPSFVSNIGHLRTILVSSDEIKPDQSFVDSCVSRFPRLRVLDLEKSNIEVLLKKIGNLKHLRYLDLSQNCKLKKLSKSICKLQKLETLFLNGCSELKEIPRELRYLTSLRMLSITTKQKRLPENIIGCLNSLRFLGIDECENLEYLCGDIGSLKALQTMFIRKCPSLLSLPCDIKYSTSLKTLLIIDCEKLNLRIEMEEDDSRQDLNSTRIQLRSIIIKGLPNVEELPQWLLHGNTLESLTIDKCPNFIALPESMQNLQSLQHLFIVDCPKLTSLPEGMHRLIALRRLIINGCPALSGRCEKDTGEDWHKIAHIPWIQIDDESISQPQLLVAFFVWREREKKYCFTVRLERIHFFGQRISMETRICSVKL
ncbi:hypothetical protein LWI28_015856 [Acer negundo]|uniref:Rx N-terminal domain-containing protein n=1 Tax=Acer negundo TaxID=4023 RepID=A0AAD5P245_ACENE|nr:hypothetical protein LWI28_015856 [Acer negundo]